MSGEEIQEDSFSSDEEFDEEADSESSSDVDAKVAADEVFDREFLKCYAALKSKDDKIYDKNIKFFSEPRPEDAEQDEGRSTRPRLLPVSKPKVTLLDYQLGLKDDEIEKPELEGRSLLGLASNSTSHYEKELEEIKRSIGEAGDNVNSDSEDELLVIKDPKPGTSGKLNKRQSVLDKLGDDDDNDIKQLKQLWSDPKNLADEDKYLRDYILNKRYLPSESEPEKGGFFSKNLEQLSDVEEEEEKEVGNKRRQQRVVHHSDEKDFDKILRVPRNSTKTIRDLVEKQQKREKRLKDAQKKKKKREKIEEDIEFRYQEIEPVDYKMTAEEILMAPDSDLESEKGAKRIKAKRKSKKKSDDDKVEVSKPELESKTTKKKKKHKRGLNHKKFAKSGVAPDRLLAYGLSKTKLKKSKLL